MLVDPALARHHLPAALPHLRQRAAGRRSSSSTCPSPSSAASRRSGCASLNLNLSASVGFIALFGVAVLNGVVMIAAINRLREEGRSTARRDPRGRRRRASSRS
ncbi:MAG: hypothetical protein MZV64_43330 [Ignavibacteriales bacterium]|nr:hypothetical protein [Ignavibacteriales bacterium]